MERYCSKWRVIMRTSICLLLALVLTANIYAQAEPPTDTARLVFIHHPVGEDWLNVGGLWEVLNANTSYAQARQLWRSK